MANLHRVMPGNLSGESKCWIPNKDSTKKTKHRCHMRAQWYVFPAGEGTLDTTQLSNLDATPCDRHLAKALRMHKQGARRG